ncbi:hypothetical protein [Streptomyces sp. NBC_01216]|uniref:hypothetical protein n=1 Tax=unclassified Streptomyces TaxID=2593676 RepID=UPI002E12F7E3|nr:hypothetical protein OG393_06880 [Streptomyces sp. NBC_01216]
MSTPEDIGAVVHLDLRSGAAEIGDAPALRARVARELGQAGLPEPDHPLFLVVDTPAGLTDHQRQYELLAAYRALGEVRLLVLLVGSAPGTYAGADEAFRADRRLVRPAVLRSSGTALLWAGDLRSARTALEQPAPDEPQALAVLVDLLSVPDVFLRVLDEVRTLPDAVAAPGVRLLEQDLPPEVRDHAWRDALTRFAGEDGSPRPDAPSAAWSATDLPEPLRGLVAGRGAGDQPHREPGGAAESAYRACAEALDEAEDALADLRSLPGLLSSRGRETLEADLERADRALGEYRELVATALHSGGSGASAEAAERLTALGLRVPSAEGVGERIGEGLREFAGRLLGQGLALRAVAQRFTALAGRVEPVPGSALLPRLAGHSADAVARRAAEPGGPVSPATTGVTAVAALAGLLGGLWQGPSAALALAVPLVVLGAALLGAARLRDGARPGHRPVGPRIAAFFGAAAGVGLAYATGPALWLSAVGLTAGLVLAVEAARRRWRTAADFWAAHRGTAVVRGALDGLDALLAEAVREHWAAEERLYCADAARSVAGMLRATAAAADGEAVAAPERRTAGQATPGGPAAEDDWLCSASALETAAFAMPGDGGADDDWASAYAWEDGPAREPVEGRSSAAGSDSWEGTGTWQDSQGPWRDRTAAVPRWLERESGDGGPELVTTLAGDLTDAALAAMAPYWGAVERGQAGASAGRRTEERVRELLATARRHLRVNGVLAPPPFAARHRTRSASAKLLGTDPYRVAELVGAEPDRQTVVQLSSPEQSTLLSRDPAAAVWIRFAPDAVRGEVETAWRASGTAWAEETLWTASGRYAGLIRLTPLRMGVVDTVRPRQGAEPADLPGPADPPYVDRADAYGRGDGDRW